MKRIISILLTFAIILALPITILAEENPNHNERTFQVNSEDQTFHTVFFDGIEYFCLQDLNGMLRYDEQWNEETQTMRLWGAYRDIEFTIGSTEYYVNGWINFRLWPTDITTAYPNQVAECETYTNYPPLLVDGKIYLPANRDMFEKVFSAKCYFHSTEIWLSLQSAFYDIITWSNNGYSESIPSTTKSLLKGYKIVEEIPLIQKKYINRYPFTLLQPDWPELWEVTYEGLVEDVSKAEDGEFNTENNYYCITFEDGTNYWITLGSREEPNTRCFDSDYNEITPENINSLTGTIVRIVQKSRYVWGYQDHKVEESDPTVYALVKDNAATAEYYAEQEREKAEQERLEAERPKEVRVYYNSGYIEFDQNPIIEDGRTLVPMRKIFETLGAAVDWNGETQTITSKKGDTTIVLTVGDTTAYKNGEPIELDVPAKIVNERTLVPVRFIAESLDIIVEWHDYTRVVALFNKD